ncbi:MAG: hypothetical protein ACPG47_10085 [Leucothrix sp.]
MHTLFYFKNKPSEELTSTWIVGLMWLGFIGWLLAGATAFLVAKGEMRVTLLWWSFALPILGLISALIQTLFGMRHYFLPTLINTAICIYLALGLIIMFTLIALYSFLTFYMWLGMTILIVVSHFLMWHYNQRPRSLAAKAIFRDYQAGNLTTGPQEMTHSLSVPTRPTPKWLSNLALYGIGLMIFALGVGYFVNHMGNMNEWFVPYVASIGTISLTLMITYVAAPHHTWVFCLIDLARQQQRKDEIKEAKRNAKPHKR